MAASVGLAKFDMKTGQVVYIGGAWALTGLDEKVKVLRHVRWLNKGAQEPGIVFIPWESDQDWASLFPRIFPDKALRKATDASVAQ